MTREMLEAMGLSKEQIDKIMAENGKDIEKAKGDLEAKEAEKESLEEQLKTANKTIEEFKEMDIEGIKAAADDYKTKYEEEKEKYKEELENIKFNHTLEDALKGAKAKNAKAVKALLDLEGLKLNEGKIVGLDEQLEEIQKDNDFLFELEEEDGNKPNFTRPTGGKQSINDGNPFSKESFNLTEQGRLFKEDPDKAIRLRQAAK